jgi:hypothetical protein
MSTYKHKTNHFGIPVLGFKDRIDPELEMRKYTIIENMLIAGTYGLSEVVFDDGSYLIENDGDEYLVKLIAGGSYPSAQGIVGGFYFHADPELVWRGLKNGFKYYLYLRATHKTPYECNAIRTVSSNLPLGKGSLLLAEIDLRDETPQLELNPDGKVYSTDVARHASDSSNPHGRIITQDEIVLEKRLSFQQNSVISINGIDMPIDTFSQTVSQVAGRRVEKIDFYSGGSSGVVLKASCKIFSVHVSRRVVEGFNGIVGEIGIGYFGEDNSIDTEKEFSVYNNGDTNIPLRSLVICGE